MIRFLDIFAGAGGLSEGFVRAGYTPVKHVEMDEAACNTLRTRAAYHYLNDRGKTNIYNDYLRGNIDRGKLYSFVPKSVIDSVMQAEISEEKIPSIFKSIDEALNGHPLDLIVGGPPCQAYSLAGRSRSKTKMLGDKRNNLYILYAKFLEHYKPKYFVFENVLGLLSAKDENGELYLSKMRALFKSLGYETEYKILKASDYGVMQDRKRIILIGKLGSEKDFYPNIETASTEYNVNSVLSDLPRIHAGEGSYYGVSETTLPSTYLLEAKIRSSVETPITFHIARPNKDYDLEIYHLAVEAWNKNKSRLDYSKLPDSLKKHKNTVSFRDRFKVVAGDLKCSQTVVAHICKDGHYYIHPDIEQNRSLTPREAARLQTFPDDYYFESVGEKPSRTAAFRQIGNAVPVLLAERVAEALKPYFEKEEAQD